MTQYNQNFDRELDWGDTIQNDAADFITLAPGDYQFTVEKYDRARHTPNPQNPGKLPACNKAIVHIKIDTAEGTANLKHNLFLHSSTEGMLSAFFGAIGQKKHGEPLMMNWNIVPGSQGVCRVGKRQGTGQYADRQFDEIKSMIYADQVDWSKVLNKDIQPQQPSQQGYQQPPQNTQQGYQQPQGQPTYQQPQQGYQQPQQTPNFARQAPQDGGFNGMF